MGREQSGDAGYEWVNAWAASAMVETSAAMKGETPAAVVPRVDLAPKMEPVTAPAPAFATAVPDKPAVSDQLMRDIAEIERARDALDALPLTASFSARRRTQAFTLVPSRTSDMVPVVVGGVLALVMLTVFGAAAAMTKLAR
jgi:hypothetical protein